MVLSLIIVSSLLIFNLSRQHSAQRRRDIFHEFEAYSDGNGTRSGLGCSGKDVIWIGGGGDDINLVGCEVISVSQLNEIRVQNLQLLQLLVYIFNKQYDNKNGRIYYMCFSTDPSNFSMVLQLFSLKLFVAFKLSSLIYFMTVMAISKANILKDLSSSSRCNYAIVRCDLRMIDS